jgi:OmpA-OmpF porin, OOP family
MNKIAILFFLLPGLLAAQDSLVYAEGNITNALTKEPVVARISYQSLPFGSKVGFLKGSAFSIPLYDNEKYAIEVEAPGFDPAKYILDPAEANAGLKLIRDIALKLPGHAGDSVAHHAGKVLVLNILFEPNKYVILKSSYPELDNLAQTMTANPRMEIQLEGHTDTQGDPKKQMTLSKNRVEAAKKYLIVKGVSGARIKTKAFGGTQPMSRSNTPEAHRMNRRVELRVLKN